MHKSCIISQIALQFRLSFYKSHLLSNKQFRMWKSNSRGQACDCQLFSPGRLASPNHQYKLSEKQLQTPSTASHKKLLTEKKSVKKILLSSNSKHHTIEHKDKPKAEARDKSKRQPKKQKHGTTPSKQQPQHILKSNPKITYQFQTPRNLPVRLPIKNPKAQPLPKQIVTKKILMSPRQMPNSDYFSGVQIESAGTISSKKISNIHFSYTNKNAAESLEITPETMTPDLIRQSSMNNIGRRQGEILHLRRAESENEICASIKSIMEDTPPEDSLLSKFTQKHEKAKSLKNLAPYQHFRELQPKSTVSSGDKNSDISGFSDVIETIQIHRHHIEKASHHNLLLYND